MRDANWSNNDNESIVKQSATDIVVDHRVDETLLANSVNIRSKCLNEMQNINNIILVLQE